MSALVLLLLLAPLPALANQPPGPVPALSLLSLLLLVPALTALAGGYAVLRAAGRAPSRWRAAGAVLLTFFAAAHEGDALLVTTLLAAIGLARGVQLCWYAVRVRRGTLSVGSPGRLFAAGLVLTLFSPLALATAIAFLGFWPMESLELDGLRRDLAVELAEAEANPDAEGRPTFAQERGGRPDFRIDQRHFERTRRVSPDGHALLLEATPRRFPATPFRWLTSLPSFRADEQGVIRASRGHVEGARCPADAPIVHRLTEAERQEGRETLARWSRGT